jgi:shikimate dehydrogenase
VPIRDLLDAESDLVASVGAVNTVTRTPDGLRGENTDVAGFRHSLAALLGADRTPGHAVVLGAGGAARAAAYALAEEGFAVEVLARRPSRAAVVVASLHRSLPRAALSSGAMEAGRIARAARSAMLLVNATPVGASESPGILWPPSAPYPAACALIDLVAWPTESRLVTTARSAGAPAMGGLEMLIAQAAASWSMWTGLPAPEAAMRAAAQQGSMPCHFVS